MKIVATIVLGFTVIIMASLFLGCSLCAFANGVPASVRTASVVVGLVCLAVMIGCISIMAALFKKPREPRELL